MGTEPGMHEGYRGTLLGPEGTGPLSAGSGAHLRVRVRVGGGGLMTLVTAGLLREFGIALSVFFGGSGVWSCRGQDQLSLNRRRVRW